MRIEQSSYYLSKVLRMLITDKPGYLGRTTQAIGHQGANIGDIRFIKRGVSKNIREIEVQVRDEAHLERVLVAVGKVKGVLIDAVLDPVLEAHRGGKVGMKSTVAINSPADMRRIYTPGVAQVCRAIQAQPALAAELTSLQRTVAIATNGTAILGLGAIGNLAGLPVMEGKAALFDRLVGLSGIPLLVDDRTVAGFCRAVLKVREGFGAILVEDVAAPQCFEIEAKLVAAAGRPVLHDDQHGTAVVTLAALTNACRMGGAQLTQERVGIVGLGAAGQGIARLLMAAGVKGIHGADINPGALKLAERLGVRTLGLAELMKACRVVVATSGRPGLIPAKLVQKRQVILALSNPDPEIKPEDALKAGAAFAADGKSVNNALAFPGLFDGVLRAGVRSFTAEALLAAAKALAGLAKEEELVPPILQAGVHQAVSDAVKEAALRSAQSPPYARRR